ncbi:MAG: hypothetical protein M3P28_06905 [Thermoproteota archaeon]|nr:hypothetical protein [Thermoproteota archaeon]
MLVQEAREDDGLIIISYGAFPSPLNPLPFFLQSHDETLLPAPSCYIDK